MNLETYHALKRTLLKENPLKMMLQAWGLTLVAIAQQHHNARGFKQLAKRKRVVLERRAEVQRSLVEPEVPGFSETV